jgi:hypothetical protein
MTDPLDEIKARRPPPSVPQGTHSLWHDIDTLIDEVEEWRAEVAEWKQAAGAEADLANERGRTIEQLRDQLDHLRQDRTTVSLYLGKVEADRARLRGLLGRLEWVSEGEEGCPACDRPRSNGHDPDCWLAAELAPDPPEGEQP